MAPTHAFLQRLAGICSVIARAARLQVVEQCSKNFPPRNSYLPVLNTGFHLPDAQSDECKYDGILYAVPKSRRSLEKRRKISFGYTKRMEYAQPKDNIVTCPACGDWHESHTICGSCYEKVRQKTAEMRAQLEKDDTYFFDQTSNDLQTMAEKHGVSTEMKSERKRYSEELSWWSDNLKKKVV